MPLLPNSLWIQRPNLPRNNILALSPGSHVCEFTQKLSVMIITVWHVFMVENHPIGKSSCRFDFGAISLYVLVLTMEAGAQIIVKGMVQGVGFRYFIHKKAITLGLHGSVRNLYDGNVEIIVEGDRSIIEEFIAQAKVGPRAARVNDLVITWREASRGFDSFEIL